MKPQTEEATLITPSELARRWGVSAETIRKYFRQGLLRPVMGSGNGTRYALADVKAIEQSQGCPDVALGPLTRESRESPRALLGRTVVARQAAELAAQRGGNLAKVESAALAMLAWIEGGVAQPVGIPVVGTRGFYAVSLQDPQAPQDLANLAHAALASLTLAECLETLGDLGTKMRERFTSELRRILMAAGGKV